MLIYQIAIEQKINSSLFSEKEEENSDSLIWPPEQMRNKASKMRFARISLADREIARKTYADVSSRNQQQSFAMETI